MITDNVLATHDPDWSAMIYLYLYYCSPSWFTFHHVYLLCTSPTEPHCREQFLNSNILCLSLFYLLTGIVTRTVLFYTVEWSWHIVNMFIPLLLPCWRWPATWVAKTCPWSLYNKITFIKPKCVCWSFE